MRCQQLHLFRFINLKLLLALLFLGNELFAQASKQQEAARIKEFLTTEVLKGRNDSEIFSDAPYWRYIEENGTFSNEHSNKQNQSKKRQKNEFDTFFSTADIVYLKDQLRRYKTFYWKKSDLPNVSLLDHRLIDSCFKNRVRGGWETFYKKYGKSFNDLSVPLFSLKGDKAIFYRANHCGGLCGGGSVLYYQRKNGKWKVALVGLTWVS